MPIPPAESPQVPGRPCSPPDIRCTGADTSGGSPGSQLWVVAGDIHGRIRRVSEIPELKQAAGVILTGDLTTFGGKAAARTVIEAFRAENPRIHALPGNMDRAEVNDLLEESGISLHCRTHELCPGAVLFGIGGSTISPWGSPTEFPEAFFSTWLERLASAAACSRHLLLAVHEPPLNTICDRLPNGSHVGSSAVRDFIDKHQPAACLCGHIHESAGIQRIGRCLAVNPGPFSSGRYATLTITPEGVDAALRRLR